MILLAWIPATLADYTEMHCLGSRGRCGAGDKTLSDCVWDGASKACRCVPDDKRKREVASCFSAHLLKRNFCFAIFDFFILCVERTMCLYP
jgi:hypothetical protein